MAHEAMGIPVVFGTNLPDVFADDAISFDLINGSEMTSS